MERNDPKKTQTGGTPAATTGSVATPPGQSHAGEIPSAGLYTRYVLGPLAAISRFCRGGLGFLDRHNGSISALATVAIVVLTIFYVRYSKRQWETMEKQLLLSERPWVKFKPRILTVVFNSKFFQFESATVTIEDTFENVGPTVALNVTSWEDVFPLDATFYQTAMARQKELCDANRHPDPKRNLGYSLFPKDPFINRSIVGPPMKLVTQAAVATPQGPRVGLVLVGCVSYRAPFEAIDMPRHQTRFVYLLGRRGIDGIFNSYVEPTGEVSGLEVASLPDGFSAD